MSWVMEVARAFTLTRAYVQKQGDQAGHQCPLGLGGLAQSVVCRRSWNLKNPGGCVVVDSRSCGSIGGCCDSRRGLCCTHFPCLARAEALASGQVVRRAPSQQCAGQPGGATGGRAGAQSYLG
eukprot:scaffold5515_cov148-Isochrysis_galbana.AAC.2